MKALPCALACAAASTFALAAACAGENPGRAPAAADVAARPARTGADRAPGPAAPSASVSRVAPAPVRPPPKVRLAEPAFGAAEPAGPNEAHAFRLAVALRAMRSQPSGVKVLALVAAFPEVEDARVRTGVDPLADGESLLVYGSRVDLPGPNAIVLRHARSEASVTKALADAGFPPWSPGAGSVAVGAVRADVYGERAVLARPQAGVLALLPIDRALDLARALGRPFDVGLRPGELVRMSIAQPSKIARFVPPEIVRSTVIIEPAKDGGLDARARADCPDAASCKATAEALEALARAQNSLMMRLLLDNLLANVHVRAEGTKLEASVHATASQVNAVLNVTRAQLGLPPEEPEGAPRP